MTHRITSQRSSPGPRHSPFGWVLTLVATFLFEFAHPGLEAVAHDLTAFLARIEKPISSESVSRREPDDPMSEAVGSVCAEREGIRICQVPDSGEVESFALINSGSPRIVPRGQGVERIYRLRFEGRTLRSAKMVIAEKSRPSGKTSHIFMRTALYLSPRKVQPTLTLVQSRSGRDILELRLPTGEPVCFDRATKEIVGGVLREDGPLDTNPDRFSRRFARVSYTGRGVMIRADQRGETPEKAVVWGQEKSATIAFAKRRCKTFPALLWEQESGWFAFRFPTDAAFYRFLGKACGWADGALPTDVPDDHTTCGRPSESAVARTNRR